MTEQNVVSREEWIAARKELLREEKEYTRRYDEINRLRRELPWVRIEKDYLFDTTEGRQTLADLFQGRNQLIVYHFMLAPGSEDLCKGCCFMADHIAGALPHLEQRNTSFVNVSRAPLAQIQQVHKRMGWPFRWVSAYGSDFNSDFHVSFTQQDFDSGRQLYYNYQPTNINFEFDLPGISVFYKDDDGAVYHTYSSYARGGDRMLNAYNFLDLTPKGRNEEQMMDWVRHHDRYETPQPALS